MEEYKIEFENLLKRALQFADGKKEHVIVLSIPDYSATSFAKSMEKENVTKEIDLYNSASKAVSIQYKVQYVDIASIKKTSKKNEPAIASDGLHPSENEYLKWTEELVHLIIDQLK